MKFSASGGGKNRTTNRSTARGGNSGMMRPKYHSNITEKNIRDRVLDDRR